MTEAERIEDVDGFSFSKGYTAGFDAGSKKFEEQLKETRKAVALINTKLQSATAENERLQQLIKDYEFQTGVTENNRLETIKDLRSELKSAQELNRELVELVRKKFDGFTVHWSDFESLINKAK